MLSFSGSGFLVSSGLRWVLSLSVLGFSLFFSFMISLTNLMCTDQVFGRMSFSFGFVWYFYNDWTGVVSFRSKLYRKEVFPSSHYMRGAWYLHDIIGNVDLGHLVKVVCASFLHCKVTIFFFLFILYSLETGLHSEGPLAWGSSYIYYLQLLCKFFLLKGL